jgi:hypothetical protein
MTTITLLISAYVILALVVGLALAKAANHPLPGPEGKGEVGTRVVGNRRCQAHAGRRFMKSAGGRPAALTPAMRN